MPEYALKEYIQPFPGIRDFVFTPPATGRTRTWIYAAAEEPQSILNFHLSSLMTHGWIVTESGPSIVAERGGSSVSVSATRRRDETRIVYELSV